MKRYIYIIIGIIVAAAIAILVLFLIKNNSSGSAPSITGATSTTTGSLPAAGTQGATSGGAGSNIGTLGLPSTIGSSTPAASANGQVTVQNFGVLSQNPVLDYFIDTRNNIIAIEPTGAVITISNGQSATINSSTVAGIISANFSYDGKKIVVSYGDVFTTVVADK